MYWQIGNGFAVVWAIKCGDLHHFMALESPMEGDQFTLKNNVVSQNMV